MRISSDNIDWIGRTIKRWERQGKRDGFDGLSKHFSVSRQTASTWYKKHASNSLKCKTMPPALNKFSDSFNKSIFESYISETNKLVERLGKDVHRPTLLDFKLCNKIKCSTEHIRKVLISENTVFARTKRKTKREIRKAIRKKLLKTNKKDELSKLKEQLNLLEQYKPLTKKSGICGQVVEIDACSDLWVNGEKQNVYFAVDAFSNVLLAMWVEKEETTSGYINLLTSLFKTHGLPYEIRGDKRRSFWGSDHTVTHIGNMLSDLGIKLRVSSVPTFKPNVERAFQNAQNIFPYFYMDKKINTEKAMLKNIEQTIIFYNNRYSYFLNENNSFLPSDQYDIDNIMTLRANRIVSSGNVISFNGEFLAPYLNGKRYMLTPGSKVEILIDTKGNAYSILGGIRREWKSAKGIIDIETRNINREIEFNKRKMASFKLMLDNQKNAINRKINELQKSGVQIDNI